MTRLSNRIFGEVARPTDTKSMKVVKIFSGMPAHLNPELVKWYPRHKELKSLMSVLSYHGLYKYVSDSVSFMLSLSENIHVLRVSYHLGIRHTLGMVFELHQSSENMHHYFHIIENKNTYRSSYAA